MSEVATATKSGAPDPLIGRVIADRFKIRSLIARGGMGKVYLAEQAPLGRLCAVKILNANYTGDGDPEFQRRFFREARITSQITHPNSVTIFDYGKTDDDVFYMAMEYLEGRTLYQALRENGPMAEDRVGRIGAQLCRALREAHALGVVHRDLKPANIFLTNHGEVSGDGDFVKVLDFGLVKHLSERPEEQLTQTGLFMGSPKYMAPEQIQGGHVDARTDVYSLGIILYEMLAGKVPFERPTSVNILMAHVAEPPPAMREVNPNLVCSPAFEELVMRCIAKDPAERFASMDEVLYAIRLAHGGSMTGQLGSLSAAQAGALVGGGMPSHPPSMRVLASASHTPGPLLRMNGTDASSRHSRPRSRWWIAAGVVVAAAIGGGLGMLAFRLTSHARGSVHAAATAPPSSVEPKVPGEPPPPGVDVVPSEAAASPNAEAPTGAEERAAATTDKAAADHAASAASAEKAAAGAKRVSLSSDPPGASVREGNVELCAATPCEVVLRGASNAAHTLAFTKKGFHTETRSVKDVKDESELHVRLSRTSSSVVTVSAPSTKPASASSNESKSPPPAETGKAPPSGFKDTPY